MRNKLQVFLHLLVVTAMLLAAIGIAPASASAPAIKIAEIKEQAPKPTDETILQPTRKMIDKRQAKQTDCFGEEEQNPEVDDDGSLVGDEGCAKFGEREGNPLLRDEWFYARRLAGDPSVNFTMEDAAALRAKAADHTAALQAQQANAPVAPNAFSGAWTGVGPNPIVLSGRGDGMFDSMAGRIGALAVRSTAPYTIYLGGAQGGIWQAAWSTTPSTNMFTAKTDQLPSLAIGAIALAPSNEDIVYVGTGEGALSGDSYFGNGILKSTDAGETYFKVSAAGYFTAVSISKIVVDKDDPNTLYVGTLRGRGGIRRTSPPDASPFGVWKSTDGGVNWTPALIVQTNVLVLSGVTDLAMDPQDSQVIYASILGRGISKTVDGGATWTTVNLPPGNYSALPSRVALGIGRPSLAVSATVYAGFEFINASGSYRASRVYKSTDDGNTWAATVDNGIIVRGYCGTQCTYDNLLAVDPYTPTIVYALGLYNYSTGSGGIYRSEDGGDNWVDLGFNLHPDYHAIAIRTDDPTKLVMGNDGGAWLTSSRGGRPNGSSDPITATDWINLNGTVNPNTLVTTARTGIQLAQATSVATNPVIPNRFYEGTQDNGTQRKSTGNNTWFDVASGDGGQVMIDPTDANYLYGMYYGISPYRFTDGGGLYFGGLTSNEMIMSGLDDDDRSEFYVPWLMNPGNSEQLYLGSYRVYRTDNAKAEKSSDVWWFTISDDLTSGCTGAASNGGRGCVISALGAPAESGALYAGTEEGWIWLATDAATADEPDWNRVDISGTTPLRPVAGIAVDQSNYRVAYVAFNGFNVATPSTPGHIFKTTDAGTSWTRIDLGGSGFPDVPVNSIRLDRSDPNTLYAGTDVGPYVTYDGGATWTVLGTGFPIIAVHAIDLNPYTRQLVMATHGRGVWKLDDQATLAPALQIGKADNGNPAGPNGYLTYEITVKNYGNVTATNVIITDPVPANTTFVSAGSGGSFDGTNVVWTLPEVAKPSAYATSGLLGVGLAPGEETVTFTVQITSAVETGDVIVNDGYLLTSAEGAGAVGSPHKKVIAQPYAYSIAPEYQWDGTNPGKVITYFVTIKNEGYNTDSYNMIVAPSSPGFNTSLWNSTFTALKSTTDPVASGETAVVGVKVAINPFVPNGVGNTDFIVASSANNPDDSQSVAIGTIAVDARILLVDDDSSISNVESYYEDALDAYGLAYNSIDLAADPTMPLRFIKAHDAIVFFAGATYPGNLGGYEENLAAFLDNGGRLFISGMDLLDQNGGTTDFVHDYLHIDWDGTEAQNDVGSFSITANDSNPVVRGLGDLSYEEGYDHLFGGNDYSDALTPVGVAEEAFTDSGTGDINAITVEDTTLGESYKVAFLAFPWEAIDDSARRTDLMTRILNWFLDREPALTKVTLTGPTQGLLNQSYSFTAQVSPIYAYQPITYTWVVSDHVTVVNGLGNSDDTMSFSWSSGGLKKVRVLVFSDAGFLGFLADKYIDIRGMTYLPVILAEE